MSAGRFSARVLRLVIVESFAAPGDGAMEVTLLRWQRGGE